MVVYFAYFPSPLAHGAAPEVGLSESAELARREPLELAKVQPSKPESALGSRAAPEARPGAGDDNSAKRSNFSLYYLYYDWCCEESKRP